MVNLRSKIICALVLCFAIHTNADFVKRIIDTDMPDDYPEVSLAFDCNNFPLVAYTPQSSAPVQIARVKTSGYDFNTVTGSRANFINLEVTSNNEWWMTFSNPSYSTFAAKSNWFDWTFTDIGPGTTMDMALSENDMVHIALYHYGDLYHSWFDPQQNKWQRQWLTFTGRLNSAFVDTWQDKVMIAGYENREFLIAVKENGSYTYLPDFEDEPVSFTAGLDADGTPTVAYSYNGKLVYAVYLGDVIGWVKTETNIDCEYVLKLEHNSNGAPAVIYLENGNDNLYYANNLTAGWTNCLIEQGYIFDCDLKFDKNDKPVIAYIAYDEGFGSEVLKIAGTDIPPYNITDIDDSNSVNFTDFALFASQWQQISEPQQETLKADFDGSGEVNCYDLYNLSWNWLWQGEN